MAPKRKPLTTDVALRWSQMAHAMFLDALMAEANWKPQQIAFHGGTSLHLSWRSARYSEDLDFLLSREINNLDDVCARALKRVGERARAIDPSFEVQMRDKTRQIDRMQVFHVVVSHSGYIGSAMMKAEFWKTDPGYLKDYPIEIRTPVAPYDLVGHVSHPVPSATLETAYADKMVAFATRPRLKWRDIYDLWWIGTQSSARIDLDRVAEQFTHNIGAYQTSNGLSPADALSQFLTRDRDQILLLADPDIKNWLPPALWAQLNPNGLVQMVDYAFHAIRALSDHLRDSDVASERPDLSRIPVERR